MADASEEIAIDGATADELRRDESFWMLYRDTFESREREPEDVILRSLIAGGGIVLRARVSGRTVGLATGQVLHAPAATFLVYLAVHPDWRSKRLGRALFDAADEAGSARLRAAGATPRGTVWEIDDPDADVDPGERQRRLKRLRFFERLGGRRLDVSYVQPPVDGHSLVPMRLMFRSAAGHAIAPADAADAITREDAVALARAIYLEKYHEINGIPMDTLAPLTSHL